MRRLLCVPLVLGLATPAFADSLGINILSATHTTSTFVRLRPSTGPITTITQTMTDDAPVHDARLFEPGSWLTQIDFALGAEASAQLFQTTAASASLYMEDHTLVEHASASAQTTLTFRPEHSAAALLGIDFLLGRSSPWWSAADVRLTNLTTGNELWRYGWDFWLTAPGTSPRNFLNASKSNSIETVFDASQLYALTILSVTGANMDSELLTAEVTGLHEVPEPASIALLAVGALIARRAARRRAHGGAPRFDATKAGAPRAPSDTTGILRATSL